MTSCLTVFSISSMRATSAGGELEAVEGLPERGQVGSAGTSPSFDHGLAGQQLDVEPDAEAALRRPERAISGRV